MKQPKKSRSKYMPLIDEQLWLLRDIMILIGTGLLHGAFSQTVSIEISEELNTRITKALEKQVGNFFTLRISKVNHLYSLDKKFLEDLKSSLNRFIRFKGPGFDYQGSEYDRRLAQQVLTFIEHLELQEI